MTENTTLNLYVKRISLSKCSISINAFHVIPFLGLIFFVSSLLLESFNGGAQEAENIQMQVPLHAVFAFCRLLHRECICSHRLQRGKTHSCFHVYCINLLSIRVLWYVQFAFWVQRHFPLYYHGLTLDISSFTSYTRKLYKFTCKFTPALMNISSLCINIFRRK